MITNKGSKTEKNINNIIAKLKKSTEIAGIDKKTYLYFLHVKKFMIGYHENTNQFIAYHDNKVKAMLDYNINVLISKKETADLNNDNSCQLLVTLVTSL